MFVIVARPVRLIDATPGPKYSMTLFVPPSQVSSPHSLRITSLAEVQPDIVTVLADAAENVDEIDVVRAETARKRAEEFLSKGAPADTDAYLIMEAALRRSNLRLEAARRYRGSGSRIQIPSNEK